MSIRRGTTALQNQAAGKPYEGRTGLEATRESQNAGEAIEAERRQAMKQYDASRPN